MKILEKLTLLVVFLVVIAAGLMHFTQPAPQPAKTDTVVLRQLVQAEAIRDTVRQTVTRWRTHTDTLPGDTVWIPRVQLETLYVNCMKCADRIDSLLIVIHRMQDSLAHCQGQWQRAKAQRPWWAVGGALAGALACSGR